MHILYHQPGCYPCVMTDKKFDKEGIPVRLIDITSNPDAVDVIRGLGYTGTPVVVTEAGEHWHGYRPSRIEALRA